MNSRVRARGQQTAAGKDDLDRGRLAAPVRQQFLQAAIAQLGSHVPVGTAHEMPRPASAQSCASSPLSVMKRAGGLIHLQAGDLEDAENWYERAGRPFRQRGTLPQELGRFEAELNEGERSGPP